MTPLEGEQYRTALLELSDSESFQRSPALGRLLTYLVEQVLAGEAATLKESVIGHVLYGRPAGYDPKLDSLVRVSANRLRTRMEEHYRQHPETRIRIVLPKGSYVPLLEIQVSADAQYIAKPDVSRSDDVASGGSETGHRGATSRIQRIARSYPSLVVSVCVVLAVACLGVLFRMVSRHPAKAAAETNWSVRPFARLGGSQQFGSFSPDGTHLAFTSTTTHDGNKAIYIQAITSEEPHRIAAGVRPAWSPDGKQLAFLRLETNGRKQVVVYKLATGTETNMAELEGTGPWLCQMPRLSWGLDGAVLYTSASVGGNPACGLVAINVASHQVRAVLTPPTQIGDLEAAVSPDGSTIAFMRGLDIGASDLFVVSIHGGEARRITYDGTDTLGHDWSPDGKALVVASNREGGTRKLWRFPIAGGTAQTLTDGSSAPTFPSVNAQGKQINFTQFHVTAPIWRAVAGKAIKVFDNQSKNDTPTISPDGKKLLYTSDRAGKLEVWLSNADGSESRPLLRGNPYETGAARWSPDGAHIVMECHLTRQTHICVSDADGNGVHPLDLGDASQAQPEWSRDAKSIYFGTVSSTGRPDIYRVGLGTGVVTQITHQGGARALESWDGKWIYIARGQPLGGVIALPSQGTEQDWHAAENAPMLPELTPSAGTGWAVSKEGIVYRASGNASSPRLDVFDMQTRKSRPLVVLDDLPAEAEISISVFPDGRSLVYTAASTHSELDIMAPR